MAHEYLEDGFIFLATPNLKGHQIDFDNVNYISKWRYEESPEIQLREHDVLIVKDGSTLGTSNFVRHLPRPATVNGSIAVVRVNGSLHPEFLYHFVNGEEFQRLIVEKKSGLGVPHLFQADLREFPVSLPPLEEQRCIAEILSTVDRAIEQTEALIAKQQRIKTGLMQDILTRGIDEQGNLRSEETHQFKDSPLGRIPVEWDVVSVKDIAKIVTGGKDTQDRDDAAPYPFFVRSQIVERISSYSFDGEAVLTAGDGVGTGKVFHYINSKFDFHQRVYCMHSFSDDMDGYFFFQYFRAHFMARVAQFSAKGSVDSLRMAMIADMLLPKPKETEQTRSAQILRKAETLESDYRVQLDKLRSLKTALMQDLLTGEKRVTPLLGPAVTT